VSPWVLVVGSDGSDRSSGEDWHSSSKVTLGWQFYIGNGRLAGWNLVRPALATGNGNIEGCSLAE
jgi:hypothetical protein